MIKITDTVKHLLIINVLMYFGTTLLESPLDWDRGTLALFFPFTEHFQPLQIVTHMFMHGDLNHLFFNMFAIYIFGSAMETYWGAKKFLFYYLFSGFGAMLLYLFTLYFEAIYIVGNPDLLSVSPAWGASGAVFGLLVAYGMTFPNNVLQLIFPPVALKAKYFVIIYAVIELYLGVSGHNTGIAHFAHLGGALFGFLLVMYWRKYENRW